MNVQMYRFVKSVQLGNRNCKVGDPIYSNQLDVKQLNALVKKGIIQKVPVAEPEPMPVKEPAPMAAAVKAGLLNSKIAEPAVVEEAEEPEAEEAADGEQREPEQKPARRPLIKAKAKTKKR